MGICSQQGKRPYQEDEYALRPFLTIGGNNGNGQSYIESRSNGSSMISATHFIGLFDGHAGGRCSKHISSILPDVLTEDSLFMTNLPLALKRSFHTANDIFLKIAEQQRLHDGSTGITALLRNGKLLVGNVGDCRALLLSAGKTIQMSIDQKPTNPEEQRRIASLGGVITNNLGVTRVNGVLAVSRAFGNRKLRKVIRPDVEMMQRELTREDDFLVMASDGLWDVLRNKDVCDMCYGLAATHRPQQIAEELVQAALGRGSMDNVTCIVVRLTDYINRSLMKENMYDPRSENQANVTTVLPNNVTPKSLTPTSVSRSPSQSPHTVVQQETSMQGNNPSQPTKTPLFHRIGRNDSGDGFEMFEATIQTYGQQQQTMNSGGVYVSTKTANGIQRGTSAKHRPGGPSGSNIMGNRMVNSSALPGGNVRRITTANTMSVSPSDGLMNGQGIVSSSSSVSPGGMTRPWTTTSPAAAAAAGLLPVSSQQSSGKMVVSPSLSPSPSQLFVPLPTGLSLSGNAVRGSNREDMRISRDSRDETDNMSILMRPAPIPAGDMPKSASLRPQQSPTIASLGLFVTPDPRSGFVSPKDINLSRVFDKANGRASSASAASLRAHQRDQQQQQQQPMGLSGNSPYVTKLTTIARSASHDSTKDSNKIASVVNRTDSPSMYVENDSNNSIPPGRTHSLEDLYALSGTGGQQQGGLTRPLNSPIAMLTAAAAATNIDKIGLGGTTNNVLADVNYRRTGPRRTALMSRTYS